MIRYILLAVPLCVLLFLLYFVGMGLYLGRDVPSGLTALGRSLTSDALMVGPQMMTDASDVPVDFREVIWAGEIESEALSEGSGLAVSSKTRDLLFSVNDSGNEARLFALNGRGQHVASWPVEYDERHDFESLASFTLDGEPYLLIADSGDNLYWRKSLRLLVVREPDPGVLADNTPIGVEWQILYHYPDGYRDVEGVAVDDQTGKILLVSKRQVPAEVFELPLKPGNELVTASLIARLTGIPQPGERDRREDPDLGAYRSTPTGLDVRGRYAIVMTYKDAYLYERKRRQDWQETFAGIPARIPLPAMYGLESGAMDAGRDFLYVMGEREDGVGRAGLFRVELP
jgi:hypothetical protein